MRCTVEFTNNANKAYYAGTTVYASLNINVGEEKFVKKLSARIFGVAKLRFKNGNRTTIITEKIFSEKQLVVSHKNLKPGDHSFPFAVNLPTNCPPSFREAGAKIVYKVYILMPRALLWDKKIPFEFQVVSSVPLPFFKANLPMTIKIGAHQSDADFPKRYFRRGEYILIHIDIDKSLERKRRSFDLHLMQYINYKSKESCHYRLEKSKKIEIDSFNFKTEELEYKQSFLVPLTIPPSFEYNDDIISVNYVFKAYANGKKFKFPIVVGDVYQEPQR